MKNNSDTPLMAQYKEIKARYSDAVLFFRLGDFYEMFFHDAKIVSEELGLTLTARNKEKGQDIPMAGIPYHSSSSYIAKLINKGYKVAICEQIEDPKTAVGIVKRDVVRVITPGTVVDSDYLDEKSNNYLLGIKVSEKLAGISYIDITTGEFKCSEVALEKLFSEITKISPKEIIVDKKSREFIEKEILENFNLRKILVSTVENKRNSEKFLKEYFSLMTLDGFNLQSRELSVEVAATTLAYVLDLQKGNTLPIKKLEYISSSEVLELNSTTQKNLEIVENSREGSIHGSLFWILDSCSCAMGSRLLKNYLKNPSRDKKVIKNRHRDIQFFIDNPLLREEIKTLLKDIYDIERILGKLSMGSINGRDLIALKESIVKSLEIFKILESEEIQFLSLDLELLISIYKKIHETIVLEPPFSVREGNLINRGISEELDELHNISTKGKDYIVAIENREKESTGIKNLKIKYNKVFGYFIEITNSNKEAVPSHYIRKQTLSNAERYIVADLKEYEEKVLHAKERIESLEFEIFRHLTLELNKYIVQLQNLAKEVAYLDVIVNFATIALKNRYVKPHFSENGEIDIVGGRHPVVEKLIRSEYIKNDIHLDKENSLMILTGPNMSGKSTYMKQVALILIMAQIGSFVPADHAKIPIVDKIFTRIGASDDLLSGQSTFMLEMSEMASIINSATKDSFVILDEIGRGTSTFDGISIATAIAEHLHNNTKAKTIFATHYHELTQLENELSGAINFRIEVEEKKDEINFLRKIVKGGADKSYGIEVARVAGLPRELLNRSREILGILEKQREIINKKVGTRQLNLFGEEVFKEEVKKVDEIVPQKDGKDKSEELSKKDKIALEILKGIEIEKLTPLDAFLKLNELKKILN